MSGKPLTQSTAQVQNFKRDGSVAAWTRTRGWSMVSGQSVRSVQTQGVVDLTPADRTVAGPGAVVELRPLQSSASVHPLGQWPWTDDLGGSPGYMAITIITSAGQCDGPRLGMTEWAAGGGGEGGGETRRCQCPRNR